MAADFADYPEALRATLDVAERLNVEIQLGEIRLPKYPVPRAATRSTTSSSSAKKACKSGTEPSRPSSTTACGSS